MRLRVRVMRKSRACTSGQARNCSRGMTSMVNSRKMRRQRQRSNTAQQQKQKMARERVKMERQSRSEGQTPVLTIAALSAKERGIRRRRRNWPMIKTSKAVMRTMTLWRLPI